MINELIFNELDNSILAFQSVIIEAYCPIVPLRLPKTRRIRNFSCTTKESKSYATLSIRII